MVGACWMRFREVAGQSSFTSCSSIKKGNDLPVVGKSVALFETLIIKVRMMSIFPIRFREMIIFKSLLPGGIPIPAFAPRWKVIIFWLFPPLLLSGCASFPSKDLVNWKQVGHILNRGSQLVNMARGNT